MNNEDRKKNDLPLFYNMKRIIPQRKKASL